MSKEQETKPWWGKQFPTRDPIKTEMKMLRKGPKGINGEMSKYTVEKLRKESGNVETEMERKNGFV